MDSVGCIAVKGEPDLSSIVRGYANGSTGSNQIEIIIPASKYLKGCHAGLDSASSLFSGFRLSPE